MVVGSLLGLTFLSSSDYSCSLEFCGLGEISGLFNDRFHGKNVKCAFSNCGTRCGRNN